MFLRCHIVYHEIFPFRTQVTLQPLPIALGTGKNMLYIYIVNVDSFINCMSLLNSPVSATILSLAKEKGDNDRYISPFLTSVFFFFSSFFPFLVSAIRKRMEKDVDEVGKIARGVKAKLEAINRDVFDLFTGF